MNANSPAAGLPPGRLLVPGKYRIVRMVGKGGFGEVYKAEDLLSSHRICAIKRMRRDILATEKEYAVIRNRFQVIYASANPFYRDCRIDRSASIFNFRYYSSK